MESLSSIAAEMAILKRLAEKIFPHGAELSCEKCNRRRIKTHAEMAEYMKGWPRCCKTLANVRHLEAPARDYTDDFNE